MRIGIKLLSNYLDAFKGFGLWHRIVHSYNRKSNEFVIVLPPIKEDRECVYYTLLHLDEFLNRVYANTAILISSDAIIKEIIPYFSKRVRAIVLLKENNIDKIISYYSLCPFDDRLVVSSLTRPEWRDGIELIGKNDISKEELVVIGLLRLNKLKKKQEKIYNGNNEEIKAFFNSVK